MPTAPKVERVNHQENVLINQFLNSGMFTQAQGNSTFNAFEQNMQKTEHLQYKMQPQKYPGTKKRPFPFGLGQGQLPSAHKSDGEHQ